jgi:hypothetical protein
MKREQKGTGNLSRELVGRRRGTKVPTEELEARKDQMEKETREQLAENVARIS